MDFTYFLKVLAALFAIMSPIANLPVFLSLTADRDAAGQRKVAMTVIAGLVVGGAVTVFAGTAVLKLFGIGINEFRLAGGLLILFIALSLLHGQETTSHAGSPKEKDTYDDQDNPGVYPLTVPILLGPGAISSIIIFENQATDWSMKMAFGAAVIAIIVLLSGTFLAAPLLSRILGQTAISVMSRLMGMILAAIAMEMMVDSLAKLLPGLAG
jgi:multiple antibiotic resistance protein